MGGEQQEVTSAPIAPELEGPQQEVTAALYSMATKSRVTTSAQAATSPRQIQKGKGVGFDTAGGGGDDGGMDRIENLEKSVKRLEDDFTTVRNDVTGMRNDMSEIRITLGELNAKFNINDIRQNVEKAHTDIYKWLATVVVSVAAGGIAIYTGLKSSASQPAPAMPSIQYVVPMQPQPAAVPGIAPTPAPPPSTASPQK
ncbi:hypothetical protein G3N59_10490 [Paraburkholderia sp. Ac-20340]|uniref:hypothetical protein n=1 Tax=Paraburkholderia sp. Ac-20340 TaxID=2703888 RepID=UPI001982352C|nr:hypothetical protein [Paraburkholderia sp. Ac-20340]MBN3853808.1 hypothetical protein [Paraburkholderia sp. Ac-20340]